MSSQASVTLAVTYTPPSAPTNSGQVAYSATCNYNAQNVGAVDILTSTTVGTIIPIPFGSITSLKMLIIKNLQSTDIGVRLNGGQQLAAASVTAAVSSLMGGQATITGLAGMTSGMVGGTLTLSGASSGANNGTFTIVSVPSATSAVITNSSAVPSDGNNGHIAAVAAAVDDNFKISAGGEVAYVCSNPPLSELVTSASIVTTAMPLVVENVQFFCFGD